MSFPNNLLSPSTWRRVGLGTTALIFTLGCWAWLAPSSASQSLGIINLTTSEAQVMTIKIMQFLGIRDIAVAVGLFWLWKDKNDKAMGVMFSMWTLVCVVDTWIAAKGPRGVDRGIVGLCVGAVGMAFVGLGLLQA